MLSAVAGRSKAVREMGVDGPVRCSCHRRFQATLLALQQSVCGPLALPSDRTDAATAGSDATDINDLVAAVERERLARVRRAEAWAAAPSTDPTPARQINGHEFVIGPNYAPAPEIERAEQLADGHRGSVHELMMQSTDSKIYPGIERKPSDPDVDLGIPDPRFRGLGLTPELFKGDADVLGHAFNSAPDTPDISQPAAYTRRVVVYLPAGLDRATPAPFIVVNDEPGYVDVMTSTMDTLIDEGRLPRNLVALFVASGGSDAQGSQRGLEYDTCSGLFADFIDKEVVPFVSRECEILLTSNPEGRATMGGSSGGCAAFSMAWYRPVRVAELSAILTYS